MFYSEHEYVD